MSQPAIVTERLILRRSTLQDSGFILKLINDPAFIQNIGDRGIRDLKGAEDYITTAMLKSYEQHGFGLYIVEMKDSKLPMGMCGLLKRETLPEPDIGFAFLPEFGKKGYGLEAAFATLDEARSLKMNRVLAITSPNNENSIRLLEKLGFHFEKMISIKANEEVRLFSLDLTV